MEKILITGGAGFIGSTLANHLGKENVVIVVDDLSMGKVENLEMDRNITFIEGDVADSVLMEEIIRANQFDYIFHLAAVASVADSVARPVETHRVNFESVLMLLELVRKYQPNLKRIVFSSSAAVYGDEPTLPKKEESIIRPLTPYAIDKFAAEQYVLDYCHLYDVPGSAVRFFNVYGPNQNPNSPYSGVISILVDRYKKQLAGEKTSFTLYGDGSQSRDFVYIDDVIQALLLVAKKEAALGEQFNVGTGKATTLLTLIQTIDQILETELALEYQPERSGDIHDSLADISKIQSIGYLPNYDVLSGMKSYLKTEI
ncbi:NAD-dependent epimerase/dehydratase family protein [Enterococcus hirae]|uniref:NAD-dependent epimerase/dehydratase family protein n=1 Tax=Enterococcus hirae TaxID=1354 RepID=UPI0019627C9B|nr:NAD-dependent epimerase/dehydratase family protein [Enterococcus hirae]MBV6972624.1 NAD-dependent epimerase/dehydratase family protein [Enterococcus hirae]MCV3103090.1 NAD-dependent epimerase/dehydratase family protein [Enterococcus hirae]MCV3107566.1 NAD-dependent epimerase/dehydratase family protein [Enterococcus hirae]MCV3110339.1 NAD-dependent epimerase/dehydratase family protein [Enterococcus hirae]MCV3128073.1 NAD-dependent epimerase/dehydratase family protein [Enterococcus hirae]